MINGRSLGQHWQPIARQGLPSPYAQWPTTFEPSPLDLSNTMGTPLPHAFIGGSATDQKRSTQGLSSSSHVQALRGWLTTCM
jgi:hypothetical protein